MTRSNAIDGLKANYGMFLGRDVDTSNTGHPLLSWDRYFSKLEILK
jgi:hypothetical protein